MKCALIEGGGFKRTGIRLLSIWRSRSTYWQFVISSLTPQPVRSCIFCCSSRLPLLLGPLAQSLSSIVYTRVLPGVFYLVNQIRFCSRNSTGRSVRASDFLSGSRSDFCSLISRRLSQSTTEGPSCPKFLPTFRSSRSTFTERADYVRRENLKIEFYLIEFLSAVA